MKRLQGHRYLPTAAIIALSICAGFFALFPLTDADIFWHLASGRCLINNGTLPFSDPFAFTPSKTPWFDLHWLFQLMMYGTFRAGGFPLMLAVKWLIVSSAVLLLSAPFPRTAKTFFTACCICAVIYGQRYLIPMRPIILTLFYLSALIFSYEKFIADGRTCRIAVMIIIQIAWVNSQGLFMIGPAISLIYAVGEEGTRLFHRRFPGWLTGGPHAAPKTRLSLAILPAVLIAASLVNPYGIHAISFATTLLHRITPSAANMYSMMIDENLPLLHMVGTIYNNYPLLVAGVGLLLVVTSIAARHNLRLSLLGLAASGFILAFMAQRNGILFTFLATPSLLYNCSHCRFTVTHQIRKYRYIPAAVAAGILCFTAAAHGRMLIAWPHALSPFCHPVESARYLQSHPFTGNMFNADRYGGYLTWKLYPQHKVFVDTRLTLKSDAFFREYIGLLKNPAQFDVLARTWNITTAVIPLAPIEMYLPLAAYLYKNSTWDLVYTDGAEALFRRVGVSPHQTLSLENPFTITAVIKELHTRYHTSPSVMNEALLRCARWCEITGALRGARQVLETGSDIACRLQLARINDLLNDSAAAEKILCAIHDAHPRNHHITMNLIYFYLKHGNDEKALEHLTLLLRKNPFYHPARTLLFTLKKEKMKQ